MAWTADAKKLSGDKAKGYHGEGRVALCTRFDEKAFETFKSHFRGKGPERFRVGDLRPGS